MHRRFPTIFACMLVGSFLSCGGGSVNNGECPEPCPAGTECVAGACRPAGADADDDGAGLDAPVPDGGDGDGTGPDAGDAAGDDAAAEGTDAADGETDGGEVSTADGDGDTILDIHEGNGAVDTDGDTLPDSLDPDSDGDTIPDATEAGDDRVETRPVDSDVDGTEDFRDPDSDGDTILDRAEGAGDEDGDGILSYRDLDSDQDTIADAAEAGDADPATPPVDSDLDGVPDFLDTDSDDDAIRDVDESIEDTDGDGVLDYLDTDSDNDTVPDRAEAGDEDPATPPAACDDDELPDYRDTDSDNDGIGDGEERARGTSPCNADSDGDTVSDLIEIAYGSEPLNRLDNPRARGDFVFVVPHLGDPVPPKDTLVFSTDIRQADVYFTIDTSASMRGEIDNLTSDLQTVIVPGIRSSIPDVQFGVCRFADCPSRQACAGPNWAMNNLQDITGSIPAVQAALDTITQTCGPYEPYTSNLWVIATGDTAPFAAYAPGYFSPHPRRCADPAAIGWPCFRRGAVPIVMQFGDESFNQDNPCTPHKTEAEAAAALNAIKAKYIGVNSGSSRPGMVSVATLTGSVDVGGSPLVFTINTDGSGLGAQVIDAVATLARRVPIQVSAQGRDEAGDAVDARIFIDRIEPNTMGGVPDPVNPAKVCLGGLETADITGDGRADVFARVLPGTTVCFDILAARNATVAPLATPQIYRAFIDVIGDGITTLDTRDVYFLVPPVIPGGN